MLQEISGEPQINDIIESIRGPDTKCRIPQLSPQHARLKGVSPVKKELEHTQTKTKFGQSSLNNPNHARYGPKNAQRSQWEQPRPKSATRERKEDGGGGSGAGRFSHGSVRPARPERERLIPAPKRPSTIPRRIVVDPAAQAPPNKGGRNHITVPIAQRHTTKSVGGGGGSVKNYHNSLPDQETIKKREDLEMLASDVSNVMLIGNCNGFSDKDSITSATDQSNIGFDWTEQTARYEKMKADLSVKQEALIRVYASLRRAQEKLAAMGKSVSWPGDGDLRVVNVGNMSAEMLLKTCSQGHSDAREKGYLAIDVKKIYNMPTNLIATCEETLHKRREIIDWLDSLVKSGSSGIKMKCFLSKVKEFTAENEMLSSSLERIKNDFIKDLNEIIDFVRKSVNEAMALQVRTEEMTYQLSEINSLNADLRKQIATAENLKSHCNRVRLEELEKDLKDEKCKLTIVKDRLTRTEGQLKIGKQQVSQLEGALEQARCHTRDLELDVHQLRDQNQKLQADFDKELTKLNESITENTAHLEEIAESRERLQSEKEDLEKRLEELSQHYDESISNLKQEKGVQLARLIEAENRRDEECEKRKQLEDKVESLCAQLLESKLRNKDITKLLEEKDTELNIARNKLVELEETKQSLEHASNKIKDFDTKFIQQNEAIKEIENNFKESVALEENLKRDLSNKEEYIHELEKKLTLLEQQLQDSESKMEIYEEQLNCLKNHISQLQEDFGEFENLKELHVMINEQRSKLEQVIKENSELADAIQKKDLELDENIESLNSQVQMLEEKDLVIKMFSEKEMEQANIIKLLRHNLEMRGQDENNFTQKLADKDGEIESLKATVNTKKQQISQMEKILLTLEEQIRKATSQRNKDRERINSLEIKLADYEAYHSNKRNIDVPTDNLDNLIKILEDELGSAFDSEFINKDEIKISRTKQGDRIKKDKIENFECHESNNSSAIYKSDHDPIPTKIVMGNYVKRTYLPTSDDRHNGDKLDRKKAITNIDPQPVYAASPTRQESGIHIYGQSLKRESTSSSIGRYDSPTHFSDSKYLSRNLQYGSPNTNNLREERKNRMFKLAGHRLSR